MWRNKPLLRRDGDKIFKSGIEAAQMLIGVSMDLLEYMKNI